MCTKRRGANRCTSSVFTRTFKALSAHKHFIFDAVETNFRNGYNRKTGIFTANQIFLDHSRRGSSYHVGSSAAYKETAAVLTQNGAAKGSIYAGTEI